MTTATQHIALLATLIYYDNEIAVIIETSLPDENSIPVLRGGYTFC